MPLGSFPHLLVRFIPLATCLLLALTEECPRYVGSFRDCTCGVSFRDEEVRCCTPDTCQAPQLSSTNLTCPFVCQNGGMFNPEQRDCSCPRGFYGLCCERGENRPLAELPQAHTVRTMRVSLAGGAIATDHSQLRLPSIFATLALALDSTRLSFTTHNSWLTSLSSLLQKQSHVGACTSLHQEFSPPRVIPSTTTTACDVYGGSPLTKSAELPLAMLGLCLRWSQAPLVTAATTTGWQCMTELLAVLL